MCVCPWACIVEVPSLSTWTSARLSRLWVWHSSLCLALGVQPSLSHSMPSPGGFWISGSALSTLLAQNSLLVCVSCPSCANATCMGSPDPGMSMAGAGGSWTCGTRLSALVRPRRKLCSELQGPRSCRMPGWWGWYLAPPLNCSRYECEASAHSWPFLARGACGSVLRPGLSVLPGPSGVGRPTESHPLAPTWIQLGAYTRMTNHCLCPLPSLGFIPSTEDRAC